MAIAPISDGLCAVELGGEDVAIVGFGVNQFPGVIVLYALFGVK